MESYLIPIYSKWNFCIAGIDLGVAFGIAPFGRPISNAEI